MKKTRICGLLNITHPIIQAPMTWITSAEMVAAVSEAGGLGTLGPNAGFTTGTADIAENGERLRRQIRRVRELTGKPFAVNLIIALPDYPKHGREYSDECLKVIIEERVPIVITVGDDTGIYTSPLKQAGITVLHRAAPVNVKAAQAADQAGAGPG